MKIKCAFFILTIFLISSCKKEELEKISEPNHSEKENREIPEIFQQEFTEYNNSIIFRLKGARPCGNPAPNNITRVLQYRLKSGEQSNDQYYYILERRKIEYNCNTSDSIYNWNEIGYYRYVPQEQKSYYYTQIGDNNPTLLMNFNVNIGDTITLDSITNSKFVVNDVKNTVIGTYQYPHLEGKIIRINDSQSDHPSYTTCILNPFSPNPLIYNETLSSKIPNNIPNDDFCDFIYGAYIISLNLKLTDANENEVYSVKHYEPFINYNPLN